MIKLFDGERVLIPVKEIKDFLHWVAMGCIDPSTLIDIDGYPPCLEESTYNQLLVQVADKDGKELDEDIELTKVTSLTTQMQSAKALRPLKHIVLHKLLPNEEIVPTILAEEEEEREKLVARLTKEAPESSNRFVKTLQFLNRNADTFKKVLAEYGLELQYMTEIKNGRAGLLTFLVGNNIFYEIHLNDWADDHDINLISIKNDTLILPDVYGDFPDNFGTERIELKNAGGDFRKHTVRENLFWCLSHLNVRNEFTDEVSYDDGGIHFHANIALITKLINPVAFPEWTFIEGIADITKKEIVPERVS